jgi:hypothetical protein
MYLQSLAGSSSYIHFHKAAIDTITNKKGWNLVVEAALVAFSGS